MNLSVKNLHFRYGESFLRKCSRSVRSLAGLPVVDPPWVIDGFSFDFTPGGFIALQGYSGSGKSTVLKLAAGFLSPTSGSITAPSGRCVRTSGFRRAEVGYVFQQLNLLPRASVSRNIMLAWAASGMNPAEAARESARILAFVGLDGMGERTPDTLSGGQQQRAAIARALVKRPSVLLMDEPTSGLDDGNTDKIREIISVLSPNTVCVVATHDARLLGDARTIVRFPL